MGLFKKTPPPAKPVRRRIEEICATFADLVTELRQSVGEAAEEEKAATALIQAANVRRQDAIAEQQRGEAVITNIETLMATDLDGDGVPDELSLAIAEMESAPKTTADADTGTDEQ